MVLRLPRSCYLPLCFGFVVLLFLVSYLLDLPTIKTYAGRQRELLGLWIAV